MRKIDNFTRGYIVAALWSTNDESTPSGGEPLDKNYDVENIAPETLDRIVEDCEKFQRDNAADLVLYADMREYDPSQGTGVLGSWSPRGSRGSSHRRGKEVQGGLALRRRRRQNLLVRHRAS